MTSAEKLKATRSLVHHKFVKRITANGAIWLKTEFRNKLYETWLLRQSPSTIEKGLTEVGLGKNVTGKAGKSSGLHKSFKERLQREKNLMAEATAQAETTNLATEQKERANASCISSVPCTPRGTSQRKQKNREKTEAELVQEGILVKTARGFALAPVFIELCEENYPDKMPADILFELGIKISDVKSYRLKPLMKKLMPEENMMNIDDKFDNKFDEEEITLTRKEFREMIQEEVGKELSKEVSRIIKNYFPQQSIPVTEEKKKQPRPKSLFPHPYVIRDAAGNDRLSEAFYNDAKELLPFCDIESILAASELHTEEHPWIDSDEILQKIQDWHVTDAKLDDNTILADKIRANQLLLMEKAAEQSCKRMSALFAKTPTKARKEICLWLSRLPEYPGRSYNTRDLLAMCGISKSIYYRYVNDRKYGMRIVDRQAADIRIIRAAFDYKGYGKGARQVYMLISRLSPEKRMSVSVKAKGLF